MREKGEEGPTVLNNCPMREKGEEGLTVIRNCPKWNVWISKRIKD